ncbi:MAG: hypothetical protein IH588_10840 [Anaerolineales bacterium]|nr:hypothetical protein [Anaerolineales bacterium]
MKSIYRITILYLTIPFIIFCVGWLRLSVAVPAVVIILFALWQLLRYSPRTTFNLTGREAVFCLLLTGTWVFLSGVGGYAFQNWDHHWRNAVLHDLINYDWPVFYSTPESGPVKMLVYYVGYWLPSALVGKLFGWGAANLFLFLWTWLGVLLVALHLSFALKTSPVKSILLLSFFSGMDVLGTLFLAPEYPTLLPVVTHLEIWNGSLQYSSFTTQLFWVFNQAVPAWLCIALILNNDVIARTVFFPTKQSPNETEIVSGEEQERPRNDMQIFLWSLCFFFAPLASIGLLPYLLIEIIKQTDFKSPFRNLRWDILLAAVIIFLLSTFFFTSNTAAQSRGFQSLAIEDFFIFFLLEGGILWFLLVPVKRRDPRWMVTGVLLAVIPFIQLGNGNDFVMRASIAPLFYLMMMVGEVISQNTTPRILRFTFYCLLLAGSFTPLYEMNRSAYRTYQYYFVQDESNCSCDVPLRVTHLEQGGAPELEHPNTLVADEIRTLKYMDDKLSKNFIANVRQTLYYRYISPR